MYKILEQSDQIWTSIQIEVEILRYFLAYLLLDIAVAKKNLKDSLKISGYKILWMNTNQIGQLMVLNKRTNSITP